MELYCKNCGGLCGHWLVTEVQGQKSESESQYKCLCQKCGAVWLVDHNPLKNVGQGPARDAETAESFGVPMPPAGYYLHQGHAWAAVEEDTGLVRVGLDAFSQKILGPADELRLPAAGTTLYQDHICMAEVKKDHKASFEAPVDGTIVEVNAKVGQKPRLLHDDPYGEGWLFKVKPSNLKQNLDKLFSGEKNTAWMGKESHRLLNLLETTAGVTLPSGGALVDDVYDHFPQLGWRRLVKEFFLTNVTRNWKKR